MATQAELRQAVRDNLYGAYPTDRPFVTLNNGAIADGVTTTITMDDGTNWAAGDIGEVLSTAEQFLVTAVATNDLTVIRAWNGTTGAAIPDNSPIQKNPRFTIQQIDKGIEGALNSLEAWGVHAFSNGFITREASTEYYELNDVDMVSPYNVLSLYYADENSLRPMPLPYRYHEGLGSGPTEWSVGSGLIVHDWGDVAIGEKGYYAYAQQLTDVANLSTNQETIVVLGAAALVLGKAIAPASHDPGARTDRTVPVGQVVRDGRWFQGEFFIRVRAEAADVAVKRQKRYPSTVQISRARRWAH